MIDLDRVKERVDHAFGWLQENIEEPAFYGSCKKIDEITDDVEALCREVEEQRSLISELRQQAQIHAQEARTQTATVHEIYQICSGAKGEAGNWHGAEPVRRLIEERDELRRENEKREALCDIEYASGARFGWNCAVADDDERFDRVCRNRNRDALQELKRLRQRTGGTPDPYYETQPGSPKFEGGAAWERYLDEEPAWLPAPDSQPADMADAQMLTVRDQSGTPMHDIVAAAEIAWGRWEIYYEYRPLYSDSGPPLCSPKGLEEWAEFVATDSDGSVWQFSSKPIFGNHYRWEAGSGAILQAPSSHRKGRRCCESLMEVMR